MIFIDCYNCGSSQTDFYAAENGFKLVKCCSCGLVYVNPRPSQKIIDEAQKIGVHQGDYPLDVIGKFNASKVNTYLKILRDLYKNHITDREKTWLDIGCGYGEFIHAIHEFSHGNIKATGLEPNIQKQKSARARGLNVRCFNLRNHDKKYDYISLLNVYSHLSDPPEFIRQCKYILKTRGELLIETGDTANLTADEHYRPFYLPDHLSYASEEIVSQILDRCGFRIIAKKKYPASPFNIKKFNIIKELLKVFLPHKNSKISQLFNEYRKSRKYITDMYIRAVSI
ncbi:class I SAM-dependent methyltransferase [candidate division CSSED10-310 bacterium]|uniref:Class I SAM-dependent methyltransferase n=1 Tax=candidate division CSSED10-310 bacterium TaxID=2855610 RepID=A0ABV6YYF7_UNCC1